MDIRDQAPELAPIPWTKIKGILFELGATDSGDDGHISLAFEGQGHFGIFGSETTVALDVHADWDAVLSLYSGLLGVAPDLVIFDDQTGIYHNGKSFRAFIKASTQKKKAAILGIDQVTDVLRSFDATERPISYASNEGIKSVVCLATRVLGIAEAISIQDLLSESMGRLEALLVEKVVYESTVEDMRAGRGLRIDTEFWFVPDTSLECQSAFCQDIPPFGSDVALSPELIQERKELLEFIFSVAPFRLRRTGSRTIYRFHPKIGRKKVSLFFDRYMDFFERVFPGWQEDMAYYSMVKNNEMLL